MHGKLAQDGILVILYLLFIYVPRIFASDTLKINEYMFIVKDSNYIEVFKV